jgi:hypothetical protein
MFLNPKHSKTILGILDILQHPGPGIVRICPVLSGFAFQLMHKLREIPKLMKYADLTHKIIGRAMEVHNFLGNGFQKVIYQRYFVVELDSKNTSFYRKVEA